MFAYLSFICSPDGANAQVAGPNPEALQEEGSVDGENYLLGAEWVLAWTWSKCTLCQIGLKIIAQICAQGGE